MTEPVIIKPTIGRRIWYWPSDYDRMSMQAPDKSQPCDAGVAYVHNDRLINITVADHCGQMWSRTSVLLVQDGDPLPTPGVAYCEWMHYQLGQAAYQSKEKGNG